MYQKVYQVYIKKCRRKSVQSVEESVQSVQKAKISVGIILPSVPRCYQTKLVKEKVYKVYKKRKKCRNELTKCTKVYQDPIKQSQ